MNTIVEAVFQYVAPSLVALALLLYRGELLLNAPPNAPRFRLVGVLFPALWLTAVGPSGLMEDGGFLMRLLEVKPTFMRVSLFGLVWLSLPILCAVILKRKKNPPLHRLIYAVGYAGIMGALGVYMFLAVYGAASRGGVG